MEITRVKGTSSRSGQIESIVEMYENPKVREFVSEHLRTEQDVESVKAIFEALGQMKKVYFEHTGANATKDELVEALTMSLRHPKACQFLVANYLEQKKALKDE